MVKRRSLATAVQSDQKLCQLIQTSVESVQEQQIPLDHIHLSFTFNNGHSLRYDYDQVQIGEWAENSLRNQGILSPLWVRPLPAHLHPTTPNGSHPHVELVAGMRRYLGAKHLGLTTVPAKLFTWDDTTAYDAAVLENLERDSFTPLEEADYLLHQLSRTLGVDTEAVVKLLYAMKNAKAGNTKEDVLLSSEAQHVEDFFKGLGMSWQSFIVGRLRLRNKPEDILNAIRSGRLHYSKGLALAAVKDEETRGELLERCITRNLSVEALEAVIDVIKGKAEEKDTTAGEPGLQIQISTVLKLTKSKAGKSALKNPKKARQIQAYLEKIQKLIDEE